MDGLLLAYAKQMKILRKEEVSSYRVKNRGFYKQTSPLVTELLELVKTLDVNEGITIPFSEWTLKTQPGNALHPYRKQVKEEKQFSQRNLADGTGWIVIRTK